GVGKTSTIYTIGKLLGWPVEVIIAALHEPSDFNGLPVVRHVSRVFMQVLSIICAGLRKCFQSMDSYPEWLRDIVWNLYEYSEKEKEHALRGVEMIAPEWAYELAKKGIRAVLFFDEISTAPRAVQAALLRVFFERKIGRVALSDSTAIVAAANPPE